MAQPVTVKVEYPPTKKARLQNILEQSAGPHDTANTIDADMVDKKNLARMRAQYADRYGGPPPEIARPTDEQLTALQAHIKEGCSPWTDFAVWGPYGQRLATQSRYTERVWNGEAWVTHQIPGPSDLERWKLGWGVFKVAMFMIKQATVASLDSHERGIEGLMNLHPGAWDLVAVADEICRSERWLRLYELYMQNAPAGWDPTMPWDKVIAHSSWGQDDMMSPHPFAHWWKLNVEHPAGLPRAAAQQFVAKTEGLPAQAHDGPSPWKEKG